MSYYELRLQMSGKHFIKQGVSRGLYCVSLCIPVVSMGLVPTGHPVPDLLNGRRVLCTCELPTPTLQLDYGSLYVL